MTYPKKPSGDYILRDYDFGTNDKNKLPMDEYKFKNGYRNADESELESVPDAHNENWFYDLIHQNLRYTQQVAEENKNQLENKVASYTSIGQIKVGYGLQITSNGVLSVIKEVAEDANVISYDLPVGSYMLWAGTGKAPEYFIEPDGNPISRKQYPELWEFAQSNDLVAEGNEYVSGKLFGIGDGKTTFIPFDIRGKFLKIANDEIPVGTYEEAGLPDHNHTVSMRKANKSGNDTHTIWSFYEGSSTTLASNLASNSNPIYGNSETVTPENYALRLILKAMPTPPSNAVPTGTILDYTGKSAPIGYIIANGAELSRKDFSNLYNWALANDLVISQSEVPSTAHGFYGTGDGLTTFTIPDLRGVFKRNSDLSSNRGGADIGEYQPDGLPNIKTPDSAPSSSSSMLTWQGEKNVEYGPLIFEKYANGAYSGSGQGATRLRFDASKANPIYGASEYVQPKSVSILPILKY